MPQEEADDAIQLIGRRLGTPEDDARLRRGLEAFLHDPEEGYAGLVEIYDLGHVRTLFDASGFKLLNWHYDRTARAVIVNLRRGSHDSLSASLFDAYRGRAAGMTQEGASEAYIRFGLGWFRSSVARHPIKGAEVKPDAQERAVFRGVRFHEL